MKYTVQLISDAEEDISEIFTYIYLSDSQEKAEQIVLKIEEACSGLIDPSDRGHFPPELERIGVLEYREIHFKPYRIVYQIQKSEVYIHCILDGRRDLQELLEKRVIR
jgi:toxin ParE1/3/4